MGVRASRSVFWLNAAGIYRIGGEFFGELKDLHFLTVSLMLSVTQSVQWLSRTNALSLKCACRGLTTSSQNTPSSEMYRFRSHVLQQRQAKLAKYGGRQMVTLLTGDGVGPEMINHVKYIFGHADVPVDFEEMPLNSDMNYPDAGMEHALLSTRRNGVALKGNIETKFDVPQFKSRNVELRRRLDLYANILHCVSIPSIPSRYSNLDILVIRENVEGEYSGLEHEAKKGVVESLKIVTRANIERIARFAFKYAVTFKRKKVTAVHKANIQKLADGLFLRVCKEIAENEYPRLQFESMIIDNASMQLVSRPQQFDIILLPNLYGNIISNIACGLIGGAGLVSGVNIGSKYAVFETGTRGSGTKIAGKNIANPTSFIRASVDMLKYLGLDNYANLISDSLFIALTERHMHTADVGGTAKTSEVVNATMEIMDKLRENIFSEYFK
ncbi:isocitrate dehydrogenase gamma subunit [Wuchereria bancrofti]|uniref:Isocitrate dehydrogenase [NAD] subunit, mitochondrial n=1 Tax=Wuchereria bancrofti TaxID=6293 RepID=J9FIR6_WUCBA|nr:isocitrate dehydrogenase gamma subunit [Wuchereria bancrofti]